MIGMCRIIDSDTFDIAARLKELDSGYFVAYRYKQKRFEVHNKFQNGNTLSLVLPFESLDYRTIDLVKKTRRERSEILAKEMDENNAKLEKEQIKNSLKKAEYMLEKELSSFKNKEKTNK